jgi:hypothetical protein
MSYRTGPINLAQAQAWQQGDSYSAPPDVRAKGRAPSMFFSDDEYRTMFGTCQMRATCQIGTKDFSGQVSTKKPLKPGCPIWGTTRATVAVSRR